ncbi:hypothetical protein WJX72_009459 [[Myrmecia] bisecta]|uniref:Uncharacterized protein n=1 Tax=[Myrmecia] bisecta TaxID=41462 RepID=A0AAW1R9K6_9CHLO
MHTRSYFQRSLYGRQHSRKQGWRLGGFLRRALLLGSLAISALWLWRAWHLLEKLSEGPTVLQVCRQRLAQQGVVAERSASLSGDDVQPVLARRLLYESLSLQLTQAGLVLGGEQTQGLDVHTLFKIQSGRPFPILRPLDVPVRAIVLPLTDSQASRSLHDALAQHLLPISQPSGIWLQNPAMYHFTMYHASHHQRPVPASPGEISLEVDAVSAVGSTLCPISIVLERVVVTSSGNVLACWQVRSGTEPSTIRRVLHKALPKSPPTGQQLGSDPFMLHTTLARLLQPPSNDQPRRLLRQSEDGAHVLQEAMRAMTQQLCGLQATLSELWFVEEEDLLALALNGRYRHQRIP